MDSESKIWEKLSQPEGLKIYVYFMGSYSNGQKSYLKLGNELETHVTTILIMNWLEGKAFLANNINKDFGGSVVHLQLLTFLFFCCLFFC